MNEALIVKSFGPIKDATVVFKKVTVFIGPTGGGKSTLAKLAAMFRTQIKYHGPVHPDNLSSFNIRNYWSNSSRITWKTKNYEVNEAEIEHADIINLLEIDYSNKDVLMWVDEHEETLRQKIISGSKNTEFKLKHLMNKSDIDNYLSSIEYNIKEELKKITSVSEVYYLPAERVFLPAIEYSWSGNIWDNIGLPKFMRFFALSFSIARSAVKNLTIDFLGNIKYIYSHNQDYIQLYNEQPLLKLYETASGFQSIVPLLVLLEYISQQEKEERSFIIEEPELNLYPTAQQGLLNWLIAKCLFNKNDSSLTITTHSPYILSHLNLLLYAFQVANKYPERKIEVANIVPEASWINPDDFACYQVENGGVEPLFNKELGLIDNNELDALSGDSADDFDNLVRLSKSVKVK